MYRRLKPAILIVIKLVNVQNFSSVTLDYKSKMKNRTIAYTDIKYITELENSAYI